MNTFLAPPSRKVAVCALLLVGLILPMRASAAPPIDQVATSLKFVPADASCYAVALRNREQFDAVINSKAWKTLHELPFVQKTLLQMHEQIGAELGPVGDFLQAPENQDLMALLGEMASDEVFVYGDGRLPGSLQIASEANISMSYAPMLLALGGNFGGDPTAMQIKALLDSLANNADKPLVPHVLFGFKVRNTARAEAQLKRLEPLAELAGMQVPALKGHINRKEVGGVSYMTIELDGSMIPLDEIPVIGADADTKAALQKAQDKLKKQKLVVAIGVRDGFVLVSVSDSLDPLAKLGQGPRLAERAEFRALAEHLDQKVTGLSYVSGALRGMADRTEDELNYIRREAIKSLGESGAPPDLVRRLKKDLDGLAADYEKIRIKFGASTAVSFLTKDGIEQYGYDWTDYRNALDGDKPLSLLKHVGGSPLAFYVARAKPNHDAYDLFVKYVKTIRAYVDDFATPMVPPEGKEQVARLTQTLDTLGSRFDRTTREKYQPAIADGQSGIVLDNKMATKQWLRMFEPTVTALPLPEPAILVGIKDAALLKQAMSDYREQINDAISSLAVLIPDELQQFGAGFFRVSEPEVREVTAGTIYYYELPPDAGLDKQLTPNAGLSKTVAVLSLSPRQTERMLTDSPLKIEGLPMAASEKPLAAAGYWNIAGTVDLARPWIEVGIRTAMSDLGPLGGIPFFAPDPVRPKIKPEDNDPPALKEILTQMHTALDVLQVFRSTSSITLRQNNVWVTHGEVHIVDLP